MSDDIKDLLTLAAKACGYEVVALSNSGFYIKHTDGQLSTAVWWAPHLVDGDGARMEGKLCLDVAWCADNVVVSTPIGRGHIEYYANHNGDEQAARRWASFRAAAQVGRSMP